MFRSIVARASSKRALSRGIKTTVARHEEPALTRIYGGLQDQDRIFSNIYGEESWRIDAAMKRGDWFRTKDLLTMGPDGIVDEVKASGLRGRGGAGVGVGA